MASSILLSKHTPKLFKDKIDFAFKGTPDINIVINLMENSNFLIQLDRPRYATQLQILLFDYTAYRRAGTAGDIRLLNHINNIKGCQRYQRMYVAVQNILTCHDDVGQSSSDTKADTYSELSSLFGRRGCHPRCLGLSRKVQILFH